ncbi:hypothetical protein WJX74_002492 [Apatococcus lobatus]|uniref:Uncharacterized protein n=1 Tax=Apatococcus lobatus TaxID=904363 RepID=A0AAW1RDA4_9CHLO
MTSCIEFCTACCCPNRARTDPSETAPAKQPLLQEQQMQPGPRDQAGTSTYQAPPQQSFQQPAPAQSKQTGAVSNQPGQPQSQQLPQQQLQHSPEQQPEGAKGSQPQYQASGQQPASGYQQEPAAAGGGWGEAISSTIGGVATSVVGDQLSQRLTSWLGGAGAKEGENPAAGGEAGRAPQAVSQQAPSESSGFQGDESFLHVPNQGATSSSSGFEEVPPADDVIADQDDDDEAYD